jgi:fluoroacetyl-CoA thioesterase
MDLATIVHTGIEREEIFLIEEEHTAKHVGSGGSRVLATPWMIGFMERVAHHLLAELLPASYSSVGVLVNIRHLAPTPVGMQVRVRATVISIEGIKVGFEVAAWDDMEEIGSGTHERYVIEIERFLKRVDKKFNHPS